MASVKTTVKTDVCSFSEYRVYPGRGKRFIAKDGKIYFYLGKKAASLAAQKIKPAKITWTQSWRRMNKKLHSVSGRKKRSHKKVKVTKAIEGLSLDDILRTQTERHQARKVTRDVALKEAQNLAQKKKMKEKKVIHSKVNAQQSLPKGNAKLPTRAPTKAGKKA